MTAAVYVGRHRARPKPGRAVLAALRTVALCLAIGPNRALLNGDGA